MTMIPRVALVELGYDELAEEAGRIVRTGGSGHIHTTPPGCHITGAARPAIVLEATEEGAAYGFFDDRPIEARARPLAILLHGADSVPDPGEPLEPASEAVVRMADRMRAGKGHFHILSPVCMVNPHPGRWTIVFEDVELGVLESVSDDRPLADIRVIEQLIYAAG